MRIFKRWSEIKLEDALPLLSVKFAANASYREELTDDEQGRVLRNVYNEIRKKAVETLEHQSTGTIHSILLQLIQAYRYESFNSEALKNFFFKRVFENIKIANNFHWLLHLEANNDENPEEIREYYSNMYEDFLDILDKDQPEWYDNFKI